MSIEQFERNIKILKEVSIPEMDRLMKESSDHQFIAACYEVRNTMVRQVEIFKNLIEINRVIGGTNA